MNKCINSIDYEGRHARPVFKARYVNSTGDRLDDCISQYIDELQDYRERMNKEETP